MGLLAACQTTPERETTQPERPPEAPAQESQESPTRERQAESRQSSQQSNSPEERPAEPEAQAAQPAPEADRAADAESAPAAEQDLPEAAAAQSASGDQVDRRADESQTRPEEAEAGSRVAPVGAGETAETQSGGTDAGRAPADTDGTVVAQNSDQRFRQAMRRFDRRLERERFGNGQAGTEQRAGGAAAGGGAGAGDSSGGPGEAASGEDGEAATGAMAGSRNPFGDGQDDGERDPNGVGGGGIGERNTHRPPPGTPDGSDDDIVARQLREAAESETDPELRERLWEEYRAYKNDQE